jgi:hypothetical protein
LSRVEENYNLRPADQISAGLETMNEENINPGPGASDARLGALLRSARVSPGLPPRFHEGVWRRIQEAEAPAAAGVNWLDALAALVLRPRLALATAAVVMVAGALLGVRDGSQTVHRDAQARYLAAVAPNSLR